MEKQIDQLIKREEELGKNYTLLTCLKDVGKNQACQLINHACNFDCFSSWRQFTNYCGIAPFAHSLECCVFKRAKGHSLSYRKLKSLLSMASVSAIQHHGDLQVFREWLIHQPLNY